MKETVGKGKIVAGLVVLAAAVYSGWQVGACEAANIELKDDVQDLSAQVGTKIGLSPVRSDAELRAMVVRRAEDYDIELKPEQVSVQRTRFGRPGSHPSCGGLPRTRTSAEVFVHPAFHADERQIGLQATRSAAFSV